MNDLNSSHLPRSFLALTALHEFWDVNKPILFLGEWCTLYKNQNKWKHLDAQYLDSLLYDPDDALSYIENIYNKTLPILTVWLNKIHHTSHSLAYWEILIGSFLFLHIQTCYDRYSRLQKAYKLFPNLETIGLSDECFLTPFNINEYHMLAIQNDIWNLQLCTQIIKLRFNSGINCKSINDPTENNQRLTYLQSSRATYKWKTRFKINFIWLLVKYLGFKSLVMIQHDFSKKNLFNLIKKSKLKILAVPPKTIMDQSHTHLNQFPNHSLRLELGFLDVNNDPFSKLILELLKVNMPMSFVEHYSHYCDVSKKEYPYFAKFVVGSPVASGESLKIWQAINRTKGMKRIGLQHGGGYGALKSISDEYLEHKFADLYITWGARKTPAKILALPAVPICEHLESNFHKLKLLQKNHQILWVTTEFTRYPMPEIKLALGAGFYEKIYYTWQKTIINLLEPTILSEITMRLRYTDFSDHWSYLKIECPNLKLHKPHDRSTFYSQIHESKLLIFDNLNTTHLYGLATNIPSILFFDERIWTLRDEVKILFKQLADVGIFHSSPESAAKMINNVSKNPFIWWHAEKVQAARRAYCDYFANNSEQWLNIWARKLLEIIDKPSAP